MFKTKKAKQKIGVHTVGPSFEIEQKKIAEAVKQVKIDEAVARRIAERQVDERGIFLFWAAYRHEASTHNIFPQELVEHIVLLTVVAECWIPVTLSLVSLAQRGLCATGSIGPNPWEVNVLGRRAIYPNERVRWEFEASNTTFMIGLVRLKDSALFFPDSGVKITYQYHCGWFYHVGSCAQYWSIVNPDSLYMSEKTGDARHQSPSLARRTPFSLSLNGTDRLIMELVGSTLTLALSGTSSHKYESYTDVDRSEPVCLAALLRENTVIISKYEMRYHEQ